MNTKTGKTPTTKTALKVVNEKNAKQSEEKAMHRIDAILKPTAKSRIKSIETASILAKRFEDVSEKYDELTNFIAGKDDNDSVMKFNTETGYSFTLKNPNVIAQILLMVEKELAEIVEKAESEVLKFNI